MQLYPKKTHIALLIGIGLLCIAILAMNIRSTPVSLDISMLDKDLQEINSIEPDNENYADLEFLKQELKDKQIIVLGESLHYDGGTFLAKTRLLKFLHKELGFHTMFFELGRYDMWRLEQDSTLALEQAVYPFWCASDQTKELWRYIRAEGIETAGIDIQCTGNMQDSARRVLLFDYLSGHGMLAAKTWPACDTLFRKLQRYMQHSTLTYYIRNKMLNPDKITAELDSMVRYLRQQGRENLTTEKRMELKTYISYIAGIKNQLSYVRKYEAGEPKRMQWRDSLMAENFLTMLEEPAYKDKKVIVWIANVHAFNDNQQFYTNSFINWGEQVKQVCGNRMYTLLFTSFSRYDKEDGLVYDSAPFNSLEYALHTLGKSYLYIKNTGAAVLNPVVCRVNQQAAYPLELQRMADGVFYLDSVQNVSYSKN